MKTLFLILMGSVAYTSGAPNTNIKPAEDIIGFASCNCNTIGGNLGSFTTTASELKAAITGNEARHVQVDGVIDLTELYTKSPRVILDVGSYKTIEGRNGAQIIGGRLRIKNQRQVIIRKIKFSNAVAYVPGQQPGGYGGIVSQLPGEYAQIDEIMIEDTSYVWIDHNEFTGGPLSSDNTPNDASRRGGLVNIQRGSNFITVSNNIFRNHNKHILIGYSDANGKQDVPAVKLTLVGNWFRDTERSTLVRFGRVHVLNNLYEDIGVESAYGVGVGAGAMIYAERNVFVNGRAYGQPDGVPNPRGCLEPHGTLVINGSTGIEALDCTTVDWHPSQFYSYRPLPSDLVRYTVMANAGTLS